MDHVEKVCSTDPWLRERLPVFTWGIYRVDWPSSFSPEDHPFVEILKKAQATVQGYTRVSGFPLGSDLTWYAQKGVPGAIYGPGGAAEAHNTDEFTTEDELVSATKTIALTILNWCG
jgi:acetylornithine deacetylase